MASYQAQQVKHLQSLLAFILGATYPTKTLARRLGLLTSIQMKKIESLLAEMEPYAEKIDSILVDVAEKHNDKWP